MPPQPPVKLSVIQQIVGGLAFAAVVIFAATRCSKDNEKPRTPHPAEAAASAPSQAPQPQRSGPASEVPLEVSAHELVAAYEANEVAADQQFKGKLVRVSGVVETIGKDIADDRYIAFRSPSGAFRSVQCMFGADAQGTLAQVRKGSRVTLLGRVNGLMMNVLVRDCGLAPLSPTEKRREFARNLEKEWRKDGHSVRATTDGEEAQQLLITESGCSRINLENLLALKIDEGTDFRAMLNQAGFTQVSCTDGKRKVISLTVR